MSYNGLRVAEVFEFKKQMFMIPTNDEIREEARRNYNRRNPFGGGIHNVIGERDFIAGAEWVLQKLQQHDVSGSNVVKMGFIQKLNGWWRLFLGFCPECNSDAPKMYDCKICNYKPIKKSRKEVWQKFMSYCPNECISERTM